MEISAHKKFVIEGIVCAVIGGLPRRVRKLLIATGLRFIFLMPLQCDFKWNERKRFAGRAGRDNSTCSAVGLESRPTAKWNHLVDGSNQTVTHSKPRHFSLVWEFDVRHPPAGGTLS